MLSNRCHPVLTTGPVNVPNKNVFDTAEVRVFKLFEHGDVVELDVQVLVDRFEGASN